MKFSLHSPEENLNLLSVIQKIFPAGAMNLLRRLSHLRCSSLKRWNRRRDETNLYNRGTTQSGEFRTSYDQVTHLDGGRCNAPAPTSSCGWLHQHNRGTTQSGKFRTLYDQVRMVGIRNLSFSKILQLPFDADSFRISISVLWFYALFKFKKKSLSILSSI